MGFVHGQISLGSNRNSCQIPASGLLLRRHSRSYRSSGASNTHASATKTHRQPSKTAFIGNSTSSSSVPSGNVPHASARMAYSAPVAPGADATNPSAFRNRFSIPQYVSELFAAPPCPAVDRTCPAGPAPAGAAGAAHTPPRYLPTLANTHSIPDAPRLCFSSSVPPSDSMACWSNFCWALLSAKPALTAASTRPSFVSKPDV